jgi:hypothetical protein
LLDNVDESHQAEWKLERQEKISIKQNIKLKVLDIVFHTNGPVQLIQIFLQHLLFGDLALTIFRITTCGLPVHLFGALDLRAPLDYG